MQLLAESEEAVCCNLLPSQKCENKQIVIPALFLTEARSTEKEKSITLDTYLILKF